MPTVQTLHTLVTVSTRQILKDKPESRDPNMVRPTYSIIQLVMAGWTIWAVRGWLKLYDRTNYHRSWPIRNRIHLVFEAQGLRWYAPSGNSALVFKMEAVVMG